MKKSIFIAGFALLALTASAQVGKEEPPKPPAPPKAPIEKMKDVPPQPPLPPAPPEPPAPAAPAAPAEPPPPPEAPLPPREEFPEDYEAFLKRNPSVKSVRWNHQNEVIIYLKSGKEERYDLKNEGSKKAAEAKFGELPAAPPPPPPAPPKPPTKNTTRI